MVSGLRVSCVRGGSRVPLRVAIPIPVRRRASLPVAAFLWLLVAGAGLISQSPGVNAQNLDIVFTAETANGELTNDRFPRFRTKGWVCGRDFRGESANRIQSMDEALAAFGRLTPVLELLALQANPEVGIEPDAIGQMAQRMLDGGRFESQSFDTSAERRLLSLSAKFATDILEGEDKRRQEIERLVQLRAVDPARESLSLELGSSTHVLDACFSVEDLETMLNLEVERAEALNEERDRYVQLRDQLLGLGRR